MGGHSWRVRGPRGNAALHIYAAVDEARDVLVHLVTMATADGSAAWMTMTPSEAGKLGAAVLKVYDNFASVKTVKTTSETYEITGYPNDDEFVILGSAWHVTLSGRQARGIGEALVGFGKSALPKSKAR